MDFLNYFLHLGIVFSIYFILVLAGNLSLGFGGLFNFSLPGIALFGGYISSLLSLKLGFNFIGSFITSLIGGYILGVFLSQITAKLKGDYLALVTFGFSFIIFTIALNWEGLTRGALGLPGIEKPNFFGFFIDKLHEIFIFYGLIALLSYLFLEKLNSSPIGRIIQALRDDELALASLGRDTTKIKNLILGLSGLFSALAGSLYAHYFNYLDPYSFGLGDLIFILSALFLGGLASNRGVFVGTLILLILPEVLRFFYLPSFLIGSLRQILYAVMLVSIIWFRPKGISGKIEI